MILKTLLGTKNCNPNIDDINKFLNTTNLPHLSQEQINTLDEPLSPEEFYHALNNMPNNKTPGPDGFPALFF